MGRTTRFPRMWSGALVALLLLMVPLVIVSCGGQPTEVAVVEPTAAPTEPPTVAPTEPPPTEAPTEPPPTEPPPTEAPTEAPTEPPPTDTPAPTEEPTPEPTDEPAPAAVDDTACIGCHTDEETLKLVAVEEEAPEVESEGEG